MFGHECGTKTDTPVIDVTKCRLCSASSGQPYLILPRDFNDFESRMFNYVSRRGAERIIIMHVIPLQSLSLFQGRHLVCDVDGRTQCTPHRLLRLFHPQVSIL